MPFSVVAAWIWVESLLYIGGENLLLWCKESAGSLLNQMLMCTVICKVGFPTGKGVPEAGGRSGCQLPATDTQGAAMSGNCWISITGLVCAAGSCCEVAARGNPTASCGCLRADPDRSVTGLLVELSLLWTPPDHVSGKPSNVCWVLGKMNYASVLFWEVKALCLSFVLLSS